MTATSFLYRQIYEAILTSIQTGELVPGQKLADPQHFMDKYQVSRITVTRALDLLARDGFIRRVPGHGSYVCTPAGSDHSPTTPSHKTIGIILEHVSTPFGLEMMYQLDLCAASYGYKTLLRFSLGDRQKETDEIEYLMQLGICGLIIMPCHGRHYNPALLRLYLEKFPIVMVDKNMQGICLSSVRTDNTAAITTLVQKLSEQGCRDIVFLTSNDTNAISVRERRRGFLNGIDSVGNTKAGILPLPLICEESSLLSSEPSPAVLDEISSFLTERSSLPDGIICGEYGILPALCKVLKENSFLQKNILIAAIDEDYLAPDGYRFMHMKQDETAIAKKAVELLVTQYQKKEVPTEDFLIPAVFCPAR